MERKEENTTPEAERVECFRCPHCGGWMRMPEKKARQKSVKVIDTPLAKALQAWRWKTAGTKNLAAFRIMTNRTLNQIASEKPTSLVALADIKGIGRNTFAEYAEEILAIINQSAARCYEPAKISA